VDAVHFVVWKDGEDRLSVVLYSLKLICEYSFRGMKISILYCKCTSCFQSLSLFSLADCCTFSLLERSEGCMGLRAKWSVVNFTLPLRLVFQTNKKRLGVNLEIPHPVLSVRNEIHDNGCWLTGLN
jgi:hypothetical protein